MTGIMSLGVWLASISFQLRLFLGNKPLRIVVQQNALLSVMSIRCPHMLVACGYFNYIFSINSGALGMHSLNGVPDFHIEHNTVVLLLCARNSHYSEELVHLQTTICHLPHLNLN